LLRFTLLIVKCVIISIDMSPLIIS